MRKVSKDEALLKLAVEDGNAEAAKVFGAWICTYNSLGQEWQYLSW